MTKVVYVEPYKHELLEIFKNYMLYRDDKLGALANARLVIKAHLTCGLAFRLYRPHPRRTRKSK